MDKYIVYETINVVNSFIYIGVHKTNTPYAFDGYLGCGIYVNKPSSYKYCKTALQKAVNTYGVKNFKRTTLACFDSEIEAYSLEADLVNSDFLKRNDVYNMVLGGDMQIRRNVKTYIYDSNTGVFVKEFPSIRDTSKYLEVNSSTISGAIIYKSTVKNYYITNYKTDKLNIDSTYIRHHNKKVAVYIYNKQGEYISEYKSANEAAKELECNSSEICRAAKLGYLVKQLYYISYIKETSYDKARLYYVKNRKVYKYNNTGILICSYTTQKEAEVFNPGVNINKCIKYKILDINNCFWSLEKLYNFEECHHRNISKKVGRFSDTMTLLDTYDSCNKCCKIWGKGVVKCLTGKSSKHKNYIFKYLN